MKKVLVLTVGGSPDPIVHAIEQTRPDFVYFLCSGGDSAGASARTIEQETQHKTGGECPHCKKKFEVSTSVAPIATRARLAKEGFEIVSVLDPDGLTEVIRACEEIDRKINARFHAAEVIANYSGGTKTMTLGLGTFALGTGGRWSLQVNASPDQGRKDLIRVNSGDVALIQDQSVLEAREAMAQADRLRERHDFDGASAVLELTLSRRSLPREEVAALHGLRTELQMWSAWDRFDHASALTIAESSPELESRYRNRLKELIRSAALVTEDRAWSAKDVSGRALVEDMLENVRRCEERRRFDDAAARLYRSTELVAQIRLRRQFGIRTSDVDISNSAIPDPSRAWLERAREPSGAVKLGLFAAYQLLAEMHDLLGLYFEERKDMLKAVIDARNNSRLAHGITPVTPELWSKIGPTWRGWLEGALAAAWPS